MSKKIYTKEIMEEAIKQSKTYLEVFKFLGATRGGSTYQTIKRYIKQYGIDISHFDGRMAGYFASGLSKKKVHFSNRLVSGYTSRLRSKDIRNALKESGEPYICKQCGLGPEWNNIDLTLQVDHINGDWSDCRKENLRFLCPNCHSQMPTFCNQGKYKKCKNCNKKITSKSSYCKRCYHICVERKRKVVWPSKEELSKLLWQMPTTKIAEAFGVSDKAVAKWAKKYELDKPPRGYWTKINSQNMPIKENNSTDI